jgi:hypothetical protein
VKFDAAHDRRDAQRRSFAARRTRFLEQAKPSRKALLEADLKCPSPQAPPTPPSYRSPQPSPHFSQRAFCDRWSLARDQCASQPICALRVGPNRGKTPKSCSFKNEGIPETCRPTIPCSHPTTPRSGRRWEGRWASDKREPRPPEQGIQFARAGNWICRAGKSIHAPQTLQMHEDHFCSGI